MNAIRLSKFTSIALVFMLVGSKLDAATWVSNLNASYDVGFGTTAFEQASSFTTDARSYRLQSITLPIISNSGGSALVRIYNHGFSGPNAVLQSRPAGPFPAGESLLTFSDFDLWLGPSQEYWVAVTSNNDIESQWKGTTSTAENSLGNWVIGDQTQFRGISSNSWFPTNFGPPNESGIFSVNAVLAGDFDADGDVDGADFVVWQTHFPTAQGASFASGDADGDGDVDGADFVIWQSSFPSPSAPGSAPVPEPPSAALVMFCVVAFWACRPVAT